MGVGDVRRQPLALRFLQAVRDSAVNWLFWVLLHKTIMEGIQKIWAAIHLFKLHSHPHRNAGRFYHRCILKCFEMLYSNHRSNEIDSMWSRYKFCWTKKRVGERSDGSGQGESLYLLDKKIMWLPTKCPGSKSCRRYLGAPNKNSQKCDEFYSSPSSWKIGWYLIEKNFLRGYVNSKQCHLQQIPQIEYWAFNAKSSVHHELHYPLHLLEILSEKCREAVA